MKVKQYEILKECEQQGIHSKNYHCKDNTQNKQYILKEISNEKQWNTWKTIFQLFHSLPTSTFFPNNSKENQIKIHKNEILLQIYDYFEDNSLYYIILEEMEMNLYQLLTINHHYILHNIISLIQSLQYSMYYLHQLHIIHSDIKPSNIMITSNNHFKLIDYGNSLINYTSNGNEYIQSRWYRAPEIILGLEWNEMIDIWSIGCVLFECIIGDVLFPADNDIDQLIMIRESIGIFPSEMIQNATKNKMFFEENGYFIEEIENILEEQSIKKLLGSCPFNELICLLLDCDPSQRLSIDEFVSVSFEKRV